MSLFILLCSGIAVHPEPAQDHPVTWAVSASSFESGDFAPELAIDGDLTTRWASVFSDSQWIQIDFGRPLEVRELVLVWEAAFTKSYEILVSEDGSTWRQIHKTSSGKGGREALSFAPSVRARHLKLELKNRATEWGNSLFEILVNPATMIGRATASTGDGAYSAEKAVDGDMSTRWSSDFADSQHWQIEFDEPRRLCGLTIHWETAFGEAYNIEIAGSDGRFRTIYETADGDGHRDIIYFKPELVKRFRINGILRGTGWGFSIWEVAFHDGNNPPKLTGNGREHEAAIDGDLSTSWRSQDPGEAEIRLHLPRRWDLGGLLLSWGEEYPISYTIECSPDGSEWKVVHETTNGNGREDRIFFSPTSARFVRITCRESSGKGYALSEIQIKGSEERATPIKVYQAMAKDADEGMYPLHLRRAQEFWTVVGVPDDDQESLLSEFGSLEPYKGGFTVFPLLSDGSKFITFADCAVSHDLAEGILPMPGVTWKHPAAKLEIRAVSAGAKGRSWTAVRYRVTNESSKTRRLSLLLAVLPVQVNPVWQHGGFSAINTIGFAEKEGMTTLSVNGRPGFQSTRRPERSGAARQSDGGAVAILAKGSIPPAASISDPDGLGSAAMVYDFDLKAGASDEVVIVYPLHDVSMFPPEARQSGFFEELLAERSRFWSALLNRFTIEIPEPRLIDVMRSNIAYILINKDGPWIKPGPRNYNHSWIRDGAMTSVALLQTGLTDEVRQWLDAVIPHVAATGMVPYIYFEGGKPIGFNYDDESGEGKEYDAQGQFAFAVRRYFDVTGDREFLAAAYPKVALAMKFQAELRQKRLTPEYTNDAAKRAYRGILPPSNSHEGYYPAVHSHWDNFWGLRGLKDGIHLAEALGRKEDVAWMKKELEEFREAVISSIRTTIEEKKIDYIPGCVEKGDFDPTSTSIAIMVTGDVEHLPQDAVRKMYDRYFAEFADGMKPGKARSFTPYEVRNAAAFVRMGERNRGLAMLQWLSRDSVRPFGWNHLAEMVHARPRAASYIGDMPHTWVGSGYISAVRTLFAYEQEKTLWIAAGIPKEWYDHGVKVQNLPTLFGPLDFSMQPTGEGYEIIVGGGVNPPEGFVIPLPAEMNGYKIKINDGPYGSTDGLIRASKAPFRILVSR